MLSISRRKFLAGTGVAAAAGIGGAMFPGLGTMPAFAADATLADIEAAAKSETQLVIYSVGGSWLTPSIEAFQKLYPWATVAPFTGSAGQVQSKLLAEFAAGAPTADIVQVNGGAKFGYITAGALAPVNIPAEADLPAGLRDPVFHAFFQVIQTLAWNTNLVQGAPSDLFELANPAWKDKIAFDKPQNLGASATFLAARRGVWGDEKWQQWLAGLQANNVLLTADAGSAYESVKVGERAIAPDAYSDIAEQPAEVPVKAGFYDKLVTYPYWNCVTKVARAPNLAALYINFMQSMDGQRIIAQSGRSPVLDSPDLPLSIPSVVPEGVELLGIAGLADYWEHADEYLKVFNQYWPA
jgi:iron(III) transport system substrate-binding protein